MIMAERQVAPQASNMTTQQTKHPHKHHPIAVSHLQAKELSKIRAEEEEQRKVADRARIEREAAAQRAAAQKKKEAQARKKAVQESKALAKTTAKARSTPAAGRPKNTKASRADMKKALKQYAPYIAVGVITAIIGLAVVMAIFAD